MEKNSKIYVAGHRGMVGSAIVRELLSIMMVQNMRFLELLKKVHIK